MNQAVSAPRLPFQSLDTLWLQVAGTLCNLACTHCFITCGPKNDTHRFMPVEQVRSAVQKAVQQGVKDFYFTGGEPFLHPDIEDLIDIALAEGPLTVLTNGILITGRRAEWIAERFRRSPYSLDIRISLDGLTEEQNDEIRGKGTFQRILRGILNLHEVGIDPILTVTEVHTGMGDRENRTAFIEFLRRQGIHRPRVKFLSPFLIGREEERTRGYSKEERLYEGDLLEEEYGTLQCANSRMVTSQGVFPCPILINDPSARVGDNLKDGLKDIQLDWSPCYTCHVMGVTCRS